jgi:hypothetical protein
VDAEYLWDIVVEHCPLSGFGVLDLDLEMGAGNTYRTEPMTQTDLFVLLKEMLYRGGTLISVHRCKM